MHRLRKWLQKFQSHRWCPRRWGCSRRWLRSAGRWSRRNRPRLEHRLRKAACSPSHWASVLPRRRPTSRRVVRAILPRPAGKETRFGAWWPVTWALALTLGPGLGGPGAQGGWEPLHISWKSLHRHLHRTPIHFSGSGLGNLKVRKHCGRDLKKNNNKCTILDYFKNIIAAINDIIQVSTFCSWS